MVDFNVVLDPILDEMRAEFDNGSGGGGGSAYVGGNRINIAGGTISFVDTADIQTVSGSSVTIVPNTAYKIYATTSAVTINATPPAAGKWAYDGHLEIFVASTGYIVTGTNVVLANALEPDAVNNCTVRFHDGLAIISVEDHVAGYIVVSATGSTAGTLPYALATATQEYIAVDASLNGTPLDMGGATTNGEKHIVGNGYTETIISGGVSCISKTTFANLAMSGASVTGGTMTLGDVYIPNGATVSVSGGGLAVEKVTGNGGTIDLGGSFFNNIGGITLFSGCVLTGGSGGRALFSYDNNSVIADIQCYDCSLTGNNGNNDTVAYYVRGDMYLSGCSVFDNNPSKPAIQLAGGSNTALKIENSFFGSGNDIYLSPSSSAHVELVGNNHLQNIIRTYNSPSTVTITSGAILDLTGNTNATPIAPGGGITFESGGATVYPSAGRASAYMLGGCTIPALSNTNNVALAPTSSDFSYGTSFKASNCALAAGRFLPQPNASALIENCTASVPMYVQAVTTIGTIKLGGVCYLNGSNYDSTGVGNTQINNPDKSWDGTLKIHDGATISRTLGGTVANGIGTLIVGSGVTVNGNPVSSGTFISATLNLDGTITEA